MSIPYSRTPKFQLGGIAHLGRIIDKIRLCYAGQIQDYNYLTVGFDCYLLDFLELDASAFEQRVRTEEPTRNSWAWFAHTCGSGLQKRLFSGNSASRRADRWMRRERHDFNSDSKTYRRSEVCPSQHSRSSYRLHSTLGYVSPVEFERRWWAHQSTITSIIRDLRIFPPRPREKADEG